MRMRVVRDLGDTLLFDAKEQGKLGIEEVAVDGKPIGAFKWNIEHDKKEFKFTLAPLEVDVIKETLTEMDKSSEITNDLLSIWEKFFGSGQN